MSKHPKNQNLLSISNLKYEIEGDILFHNVNLSLNSNQIIGLIGNNGSGKSTLLKIINKELNDYTGSLAKCGNIAYLNQFVYDNSDQSVFEYLNQNSQQWQDIDDLVSRQFHWNLNLESRINSLSGGEMVKLKLAIALTNEPNILLLDEPTNHLDQESKDILKNIILEYATESGQSVIIVCHDIGFLNEIATTIWSIEESKISEYRGNHSFYQTQKKQLQELRLSKLKLANSQKSKLLKIRTSLLNKIADSKQKINSKNDQSKDKYILDKAKAGIESTKAKLDKSYKSKILELQQIELDNQIPKTIFVKNNIESNNINQKKKILRIANGQFWLKGNLVLDSFDVDLNYSQNLHIKGDNGSGKSSLINSILSVESQHCNLTYKNIYQLPDIKIGLLGQNYTAQLDSELTVLQNLEPKNLNLDQARIQLAKYYFFEDRDINQKVSSLSGGQMARLAMAKITYRYLDLLILDEPTNNLDITTKNILVRNLKEFQGALIVISHDSNFVDQLSIDFTISLP